jgi:hypothetical protein
MIKTKIVTIVSAICLTLSVAAGAAESSEETQAPANPAYNSSNPFDFSAWMSGFGQMPVNSGEMTFNPARPDQWMQFANPQTHEQMHMMFSNPAFYAQFMRPEVFMEFMKPENMAAWMNFQSYQVMMDPNTMSYWMNPAAFTHGMNPAMYQAAMNPASYMVYMNPATYANMASLPTCGTSNGESAGQSVWPMC